MDLNNSPKFEVKKRKISEENLRAESQTFLQARRLKFLKIPPPFFRQGRYESFLSNGPYFKIDKDYTKLFLKGGLRSEKPPNKPNKVIPGFIRRIIDEIVNKIIYTMDKKTKTQENKNKTVLASSSQNCFFSEEKPVPIKLPVDRKNQKERGNSDQEIRKEKIYVLSGFPKRKGCSNLNGNYVPEGFEDGRHFLVNSEGIFIYRKDSVWRLGTELWSERAIGHTRNKELIGKHHWNVVNPSGGDFSRVKVTVEEKDLKEIKSVSKSKTRELINWYFQPCFISQNGTKYVTLKIIGQEELKKKEYYISSFVSKRMASRKLLMADGERVLLKGKFELEKTAEFFSPLESKFLRLFDKGFPENYMEILELLVE